MLPEVEHRVVSGPPQKKGKLETLSKNNKQQKKELIVCTIIKDLLDCIIRKTRRKKSLPVIFINLLNLVATENRKNNIGDFVDQTSSWR